MGIKFDRYKISIKKNNNQKNEDQSWYKNQTKSNSNGNLKKNDSKQNIYQFKVWWLV
jgi:hypothetical protein